MTDTYSAPLVTLGDEVSSSGSNGTDTWQIGLSVSVPFQGGTGESLQAQLLNQKIEQLETQRNLTHDVVALQIRTRYQQFLLR